jgi:hypothetical protein
LAPVHIRHRDRAQHRTAAGLDVLWPAAFGQFSPSRVSRFRTSRRKRAATWSHLRWLDQSARVGCPEVVSVARCTVPSCGDPAQLWLPDRLGRFLAESHLILRSRYSGHRLLCRDTSSGYTSTSQTTMPPFLRRFRYANDPRGDLSTTPITPASSKASRTAERWGALPFCGQPLGMIQRRVPRDVTSMTSVREAPRDLYGNAVCASRQYYPWTQRQLNFVNRRKKIQVFPDGT